MDLDLILDVFGYLPEKYFISRIMIKNFQTRVSFVDYERAHYNCKTLCPGEYNWSAVPGISPKTSARGYIPHQEYGPALNYKHIKVWATRKNGRHRKNGPALFHLDPESQFIKSIVRAGIRAIHYDFCYISLPAEKISDLEAREISKIWYDTGHPTKVQTKTGKVIEIPPRTS